MQRTRVMFAFGSHEGLDRRFFRQRVGSLLEDIKKTGAKATILYESHLYDYLFRTGQYVVPVSETKMQRYLEETGTEREESIRSFRKGLERIEEMANLECSLTVDIGKPSRTLVTGLGFEEAVIESNRTTPHQVKTVITPQIVEGMYAMWQTKLIWDQIKRMGFRSEDSIELMAKLIRAGVEMAVLHDLAIRKQVERIVNEDQTRVIIIPRGSAHRGMVVLFEPERFETKTMNSGWVSLGFVEDATAGAYLGTPLTEEEVMRYAKLELECWRYLNEFPAIVRGLLSVLGRKQALNYIYTNARKHALEVDKQ